MKIGRLLESSSNAAIWDIIMSARHSVIVHTGITGGFNILSPFASQKAKELLSKGVAVDIWHTLPQSGKLLSLAGALGLSGAIFHCINRAECMRDFFCIIDGEKLLRAYKFKRDEYGDIRRRYPLLSADELRDIATDFYEFFESGELAEYESYLSSVKNDATTVP